MIDFHSHLDLYPEPFKIANECHARGLYVLSVTTTPSAWSGTTKLETCSPRIRTALGLHPQLAHLRKSELPLFAQLLPEAPYVGEIGLDGGPEYKAFWQDQQMVLSRILSLCEQAGGRVMSLHSRHAATPILDALESYPRAGTPVLHWFSGSQRELARAISMGCWFSVGPGMLSSAKGRALLAKMPRERVLTETDGPFVKIENRSALPWDADRAIESLTALWTASEAEVRDQLIDNLKKLVSYKTEKNKWTAFI